MDSAPIPGYAFGDTTIARSPVSLAELDLLKRTIGFTTVDETYLRVAGVVLADQVDALLDQWYAYTSPLPHLGLFSTHPNGAPDLPYRAAARKRFHQWILDTCQRPFDQDWLDYQHEIGLRHTRAKKNQTDGSDSPPHINFRYVLAQLYPFTLNARPFLASKGHTPAEVDAMFQAWSKAVLLQIILWSYPYVKDGDF